MTKEMWEHHEDLFGENQVIVKGSLEKYGNGMESYSPICTAENGNLALAIAMCPLIVDALEQSLPYVKAAAKTDGHANGTYQLASSIVSDWKRYINKG